MKATLAILFVCALAGLASAGRTYTDKFDAVNVDEVLTNNRILNNYIKCLMEKGPCTPEGRELKRLLPDALETDCSKCTDIQKRNSNKVINYLRVNKPGEWKLLLDKYDKKGLYLARFEKMQKEKH